MTAPIQLQRTASMDLSRHQNMSQTHDAGSDPSSVVEGVVAPDGKVAREFTSQGTTPSGKPRLFVCGMCTRAFARLEHLRRHERSHTKEKPFDCGVCQRKFSRRDLLLRHAQKLHAGCDDAVARMRRKSAKVQAGSSASSGNSDKDVMLGSAASMRRSGARGSEQVNFNLNSFAGRSEDSSRSPGTPSSRMSRSGSVKDVGLKKQLLDKRKPGFRRASFSAQSGANYAMVPPQNYDSSTAENVEFSTPQFLPTFSTDEDSWLSNLCTIPGMSSMKSQPVIDEHTQAYSFDHEFPAHTAMFGGGMSQNIMRSDSLVSSGSTGHIDTPGAHPPFMSNRSSFAGNTPLEEGGQIKTELDEPGYSFYDIPDSLLSHPLPTHGVARPLSPIRQELEDELMDLESSHQFPMTALPLRANITRDTSQGHDQLDNLNDLDQFFEDGGKRLLGGYSFYGDNPSIPSTGLESMSSHASASPSNLQAANPQLLAKASFSNGTHYGVESHVPIENQLSNTSLFDYGYSTSSLFTRNIRHMIKRALNKYPISDVSPPSIPTNEKLEFYLGTFVEKFLCFFPFIHPSKLNEANIMDMTSDEDPQNESARVCLPLLAATLGALLANNKLDSDQLYEASRRTVHIYLESRKTSKGNTSSNQQNNPLWLIQALTLSVMYGLFSDSENNVHVVIRQLNALNSLVKTSIKTDSDVYFAISGHDQTLYTFAQTYDWHAACETLGCNDEGEMKFKHSLAMQSQSRTALTIYQLTNFILMMFNVPLTLSAAELGSLTCPNTQDEFLWSFNSHDAFVTYFHNVGVTETIDNFLEKDESNTIVFQDVLKAVCNNNPEVDVSAKLLNLSRFGFKCLAKGVYEFMQYEDYNGLDVAAVLSYLNFFIDSPSRNPHTRYFSLGKSLIEKYDYALIVNFVEICSFLDFRMVKEQSWLRNYDMLTKNYETFLNYMETVSDSCLLKVIDNCIAITTLVMFKVQDSSDNVGGSGGTDLSDAGDETNLSTGFGKSFGLTVLNQISSVASPFHSQVLFHVFVICSAFAVFIAKRNNPATQIAQNHDFSETWQLNQKFQSLLRLTGSFEDHLRGLFERSQLDAEMTNLFLLSSGDNNGSQGSSGPQEFNGSQEESCNVFAYSMDKALYVLRVGELMIKLLYEKNIKIVVFKKLSGSIAQIRKYLIDEDTRILA